MMAGAPKPGTESESKPKTESKIESKTKTKTEPTEGNSADASTCFDILTDNFVTLATAKGGIPKLREMILQLAVQGRLVPQNPEDEPASVLLERIQKEKARLIKEKKIKKQKALPPVELDEVPYELPEGWVWTRLNDVAQLIRGVSYPKNLSSDAKKEGYLPILRANNISKTINFQNLIYISEKKIAPNKMVIKGDFLIAMSSGSKNLVGKCALIECNFNGSFGAFCGVIRTFNQNIQDFVKYLFNSPYYRNSISNSSKGIGINNLTKSCLENFILPLPPLPEQHRIVERVDALMTLCDELEARQDAESERRRMLLASSLNALFDAADPDGAAAAREILAANFDLLFDDRESIAELRKTILQLAVQGRLVEQNPDDEPASVLLERISTEKARLVKEKKIKKSKALPPVELDEVPYALPEGWVWTRLCELGEFCGGSTPSKNRSEFWDGDIPWVSPKDMKNKYIIETQLKISNQALDNGRLRLIPRNSILIVARSGILKRTLPVSLNKIECTVNQDLKVIIPYLDSYSEYFYLMLRGNENFILQELVKGGVTVQSLKYSEFEVNLFPFPPLPEQHRIVERVDTLMKLCDELEERVVAQEDSAERLLVSVCDGICG